MTDDEKVGVTTDLDGGATVGWDAPHTEADDHDETHLAYELFQAVVGK